MNSRTWLPGLRLFCGFLLAPAVVPLTLYGSLRLASARSRLGLGVVATDVLNVLVLTFGVGMVYLCVLCFGVPYIILLRRAGRLTFRAVLLPTLLLSWVYSVVVYASLQGDYPFAGMVAALCVPGVVLAGLGFYTIGLWKSRADTAPLSPLLETYAAPQKPTLQM
jgi:hypothetical protein